MERALGYVDARAKGQRYYLVVNSEPDSYFLDDRALLPAEITERLRALAREPGGERYTFAFITKLGNVEVWREGLAGAAIRGQKLAGKPDHGWRVALISAGGRLR